MQQIRQECGIRVCEKVFDPTTDKPSKVRPWFLIATISYPKIHLYVYDFTVNAWGKDGLIFSQKISKNLLSLVTLERNPTRPTLEILNSPQFIYILDRKMFVTFLSGVSENGYTPLMHYSILYIVNSNFITNKDK